MEQDVPPAPVDVAARLAELLRAPEAEPAAADNDNDAEHEDEEDEDEDDTVGFRHTASD